jgi:hypothetical protein
MVLICNLFCNFSCGGFLMGGAVAGRMKNSVLLQILAAKAGIEARVSENIDTFATDGRRVFVPGWAADLPIEVLLGFFAHEAVGHIRMTDFGVESKIHLANSVLNLLEDIRIERMIPLMFPGARKLLNETAYYVSNRFWRAPGDDGGDPLEQSFFWLVRRLRNEFLGQLSQWECQIELSKIERYLSSTQGWLDKCRQAFAIAREALAKADKTADLLPAAEDIARLLAGTVQGSQGNDGSQGDQGNQGSKSSQGNQGNGSSQGAQGAQRKQDDGNQGNDGSQLLQRQVDMDIGSLLQKSNSRGRYGVLRLREERENPFVPADRTTPEEWEFALRIAAKMRGGLQDALRRVLEDEDDRHTTAGRFDPRMAVSAYKGFARDVFVEEGEEAPGLDARILLLIDSSGSMSDLESGVRGMLCGIVEALGVIPEVDLGIAFYDSSIKYITPPGATARTLIRAAKGYWAAGGTNWHEAICQSIPWFFRKRARQKNILFTLTDGDVNMNEISEKLMKNTGIECRFLIIGDGRYPDQVAGAYPVVRLPHDADATQVARGCLDLLKDGILQRA